MRQVAWSVVLVGFAALGACYAPTPEMLFECRGMLAPTQTEEGLRELLEPTNVSVDSVPLGDTEGAMVPATVLHPSVPDRRIAIVWKDRVNKRAPRIVYLRAARSEWRTTDSISIGTSLRTLERLNGRAFHLAGFAFDESGAVTSWDGGRLAARDTGPCSLELRLDSLPRDRVDYRSRMNQVLGDRIFSSQHPAMQSLDPRVGEMQLIYR